jgi:hypothetical protein
VTKRLTRGTWFAVARKAGPRNFEKPKPYRPLAGGALVFLGAQLVYEAMHSGALASHRD